LVLFSQLLLNAPHVPQQHQVGRLPGFCFQPPSGSIRS
jgi:hypothetical protein